MSLESPTASPAVRARVGITLDAGTFAQRELVRGLQQSGAVDITVFRQPALPSQAGWLSQKLFSLWTKVDSWLFVEEGGNSATSSLNRGFVDGTTLQNPGARPASRNPLASLDAVVCFGGNASVTELLKSGAQRVWTLETGSEEQGWFECDSHAEIWNVVTGQETSCSRLVEHSADGSRIIGECASGTDPISITRQQKRVAGERASLILRALRVMDQHPEGPGAVSHSTRPQMQSSRSVTASRVLQFALSAFAKGIVRRLRRTVGREQWFIALRKIANKDASLEFSNLQIIRPPVDRLYADPFVIERDGRTYLFFEELVFSERKGKIACCEIDPSGVVGHARVVLEANHHLSYPFIFDWQGETYMMPEMGRSGSAPIYRATQFPWQWEFDRMAFEGLAIYDPTICEVDGKFWLFASGVEQHAYCNSQLHLFFSDSPLGPWTPHPQNPVVFDVRRARPAGQLFWWNGELIRPGQDCSSIYGRAITLNRIEAISEHEYRETPLATLGPEWMRGNIGAHTLTRSRQYQAIDGRVWCSKLPVRMPRLAWRSRFGFDVNTVPGRS